MTAASTAGNIVTGGTTSSIGQTRTTFEPGSIAAELSALVLNSNSSGNQTINTTAAENLLTEFVNQLSVGPSAGLNASSNGSVASVSAADVRQNVQTISAFVDLLTNLPGSTTSDTNNDASTTANLIAAVASVGATLAQSEQPVSSSTVSQFVNVVSNLATFSAGSGASGSIATATLSSLDDALDDVCAAVSDGEGGASQRIETEAFTLSCGVSGGLGGNSSSDGVVIESEDVSVVVGAGVSGSVSVSTWKDTSGDSDAGDTDLLSNVVGVTVSTSDGKSVGETNSAGDGFAIAIGVTASDDVPAAEGNGTNTSAVVARAPLRKSLTCKYWGEEEQDWLTRGVYLRGILFSTWGGSGSSDGGDYSLPRAAAMCVSSHLTLFAVEDDSEAVQLVEEKINAISDRFEAMKDVDLLDGNTEINPVVPATFAAATALFFALIVASKCGKKSKQNATRSARRVFVQDGELARPDVMRSTEFESILRGWLSARQVVWILFLNAVTSNAVLSLCFTWSHDHMVFTQADKAFILYASILSTFLAVVFFEGETSTVDESEYVFL